MNEWTQVWRGILITEAQAQDLERRYGTYVRLPKHPWWTTNKNVAKIYATTNTNRNAISKFPVILWGRINGFGPITTPALPSLAKHPTARILFDYLERIK